MTGRGESGFTLVELLLSMALTALVMALTFPFARLQKGLWERGEQRREARRALSGALAWIARDLRQAGYHVPGSPLRRLEPEAIAYVLSRDEADPAGFSAANRRLVTVFLDAGDLKYRVQAPLDPPEAGWESGSTQVLAPGIDAMRCRGFDRGGEETSAPQAAALLECSLRAPRWEASAVVVGLRTVTAAVGPP